MNNAAFRNLVSQPNQQDGNATTSSFKKPMASLGSKARSMIPMTPRNIPGHNANREFARQVAEQTSNSEPPLKKFKSSAAPKGAKFGSGYTDRAAQRKDDNQEDDRAERLKNLEEQMKLGQIDQAQFERLREQIGVGGDLGSTHLVKGLDWKLLERVRRGHDINKSTGEESKNTETVQIPDVDVDDELERALEKDVVARPREQNAQGEEEPLAQEQQVLSRDEILRQFRAQRNAPVMPAGPVLTDKFKKVASSEKPGKKKFVESVNGRRREVLVITNKDGTTKRKTRWLDPEDVTKLEQQPLGMAVPAEMAAKQKALLEAEAAVDENEDIFADAGDDYDPLAGLSSGDEDSGPAQTQQTDNEISKAKRNYFSNGRSAEEDEEMKEDKPKGLDPTIMAALKRAAELRKREEATEVQSGGSTAQQSETTDVKSAAFLAKIKEQERRDAADFDYGFGEDKFGDEDEDLGPLYEDEDEDKKKGSRKRGPKKRKGNKDSVQDVMSVLEGRNKKE